MGKKKSVVIDDSVQEEPKVQKAEKAAEVVEQEDQIVEVKENEIVSEEAPVAPLRERNDEKKTKKADKKSKRATKKTTERKANRSEKYRAKAEEIEKSKRYNVNEAVSKAQAGSYSKFDGTVELHVNTAQKNMRGLISLPFASGRKLTVLAFGRGAEESGADIIGDDEKIAAIQKGKVDFDVVVTTADWMPKLAKIAAILGPRGLMPNPKSGTITTDLKKAVTDIQSGKIEYKTDRNAQVMHLSIGKTSQAADEIVQNIKTLVNSIGKTRIKKLVVAPTMGPGVKVDLSSL